MNKEEMAKVRAWEKRNNYECFDFCLCLHCAYFSINQNLPITGECSLKNKEGVFASVLTDSLCGRFISRHGTDINGKQIDHGWLSAMFHIERLGDSGEVYIPRPSIA